MDMTWFDHFPEPVFYIQSGQLRYSNAAALALEPEWTAGTKVPAALDMEPDDEGVFSCLLGGEEFQAAATRGGDGLLLVLRHPVQPTATAVTAALPTQLREQLNNMLLAAHMLAPAIEESGDEKLNMYLDVLNQSFYRMLRMTKHLELAEQADRGEFDRMNEQPLDLTGFCRDVVYGAAKLAQQAGVELRCEIPGGMIPSVGDRKLLEIMLLELISNAIKAAGKGGEAGLRLAVTGGRVLITVWDSGKGLTQAELTAVTDGASPDSLPKPGTGLRLGLPIARCAAQAHGGALLLESREGHGLQATVSLPVRKPAKGKLRAPGPEMEEAFPRLLTILADALPSQAFDEK